MPEPLPIPTLRGRRVRLEPMSDAHVPGLVAAAREDRATYQLTNVPDDATSMAAHVEDLLTDWRGGLVVPFTQVDAATDRVVGATRFLTIRSLPGASRPYAVEVGGTWLAASAQRTAINTEAKLLLFTHAFETWEVARVDLKTDARNERSRAAIARLGATFEGVLRNWQPSVAAGEAGRYRDTAIYSVTDVEWPVVRDALTRRLGDPEANAKTVEPSKGS